MWSPPVVRFLKGNVYMGRWASRCASQNSLQRWIHHHCQGQRQAWHFPEKQQPQSVKRRDHSPWHFAFVFPQNENKTAREVFRPLRESRDSSVNSIFINIVFSRKRVKRVSVLFREGSHWLSRFLFPRSVAFLEWKVFPLLRGPDSSRCNVYS